MSGCWFWRNLNQKEKINSKNEPFDYDNAYGYFTLWMDCYSWGTAVRVYFYLQVNQVIVIEIIKILWKIIDWIAIALPVILIASILFIPLQFFALYADDIFALILVFAPLSIAYSIYKFVKETPKRKWGKPKVQEDEPKLFNIKIKTWKSIGEWTAMIIILIIIWQYKNGSIGSKECPDLIRGKEESKLVIQYYYSPFCPACWKGETLIKSLIKKHPDARFENYDVRYCKESMIISGIRGSPAYHISSGNASGIIYGSEPEKVEKELCNLSGC